MSIELALELDTTTSRTMDHFHPTHDSYGNLTEEKPATYLGNERTGCLLEKCLIWLSRPRDVR